jgi:hypothetical protein
MIIRAFTESDLVEIEKLHNLYFKDESFLLDYMKLICAFVVEDEKGIITMGGVRDIAECTAVTNMERDPNDRLKALYKLLDASLFVCRKSGYDQMHVWSQNPRFSRRMIRNGFRLHAGQSLIIDL